MSTCKKCGANKTHAFSLYTARISFLSGGLLGAGMSSAQNKSVSGSGDSSLRRKQLGGVFYAILKNAT